jgi:Domain of unknown function (DUF4173)
LWLYSEAYGLTVLRVLAVVVEAWLALVLVMVAVAGARRRGSWVPRATVLSGAALFSALALTGPDAVVAASHVERFERTGAVDVSYLSQLSADAAPALARLPEPYRSCVLAGTSAGGPAPGEAAADDDLPWTSWNLARRLAADPAHQPVIMSAAACWDTSTTSDHGVRR